jgi:hypothetical protein
MRQSSKCCVLHFIPWVCVLLHQLAQAQIVKPAKTSASGTYNVALFPPPPRYQKRCWVRPCCQGWKPPNP